VDTAGKHTDGLIINVKGFETPEEQRIIRPGHNAHFTTNAMGIDDLSCFQILLLHIAKSSVSYIKFNSKN
jgi:hypothetical protein